MTTFTLFRSYRQLWAGDPSHRVHPSSRRDAEVSARRVQASPLHRTLRPPSVRNMRRHAGLLPREVLQPEGIVCGGVHSYAGVPSAEGLVGCQVFLWGQLPNLMTTRHMKCGMSHQRLVYKSFTSWRACLFRIQELRAFYTGLSSTEGLVGYQLFLWVQLPNLNW